MTDTKGTEAANDTGADASPQGNLKTTATGGKKTAATGATRQKKDKAAPAKDTAPAKDAPKAKTTRSTKSAASAKSTATTTDPQTDAETGAVAAKSSGRGAGPKTAASKSATGSRASARSKKTADTPAAGLESTPVEPVALQPDPALAGASPVEEAKPAAAKRASRSRAASAVADTAETSATPAPRSRGRASAKKALPVQSASTQSDSIPTSPVQSASAQADPALETAVASPEPQSGQEEIAPQAAPLSRPANRRGGARGRSKTSAARDAALPEHEGPGLAANPDSGPESGPDSEVNAAAGASSDAGADAAASSVPAEFPTGFGDSGPEDFFASEDEQSPEAEGEGAQQGERRRRSRSRRGRGRKKSAAQNGASENGAENGDSQAASLSEGEPVIIDLDEDQDVLPAEEGKSEARAEVKAGRRKMFVSVLPEEQIEVVITEEGQVQEYYVEMLHQAKTKGNIYKGVIHNVDPNLQAAFVSYGAVKNGFLQIDEVHPEYYVAPHDAVKGRKYPPIQKVLKAGQEVLVQIVKEPAGTKGAFLTTYLSLPGRFLVLTPGREQIGVSRKVDNDTERSRLRELLEGLSPGPGLGVIVRTVSMGASKTSLQRDLQYLKRNWKEVRARGTSEKAPCLIYQEMDLTARAVRDYLTEAIGEVWIDDEATATEVGEIAEALFPRKKNLVRVHKETGQSLFERFNIQRQLDQIQSREVVLPSGGRLVIDPTEALTAIDINSGRSGGKTNFEDMAFRTNMEAARMIPLQLRLRDIGGQVVADFIEMRDKSHWREVEKTLRNGMKVDRARYDVGKIGPFGLLEIVRQRLGSSAISISTEPCPCCNGTGVRRNMEWQSQHSLRDILRLLRNAQAQNETSVTYSVEQPLALHLLNQKRQRLLEMEQRYGVKVDIRIKPQEIQ